MNSDLKLPELVVTFASSIFAGTCLYITLVQHPAFLQAGTQHGMAVFPHMLNRARILSIALTIITVLFGIVSYIKHFNNDFSMLWLYGSVLNFAVIPFTHMYMLNINNKIYQEGRDQLIEENKVLLDKWGQRHAVRTILSLISAFLILVAFSKI